MGFGEGVGIFETEAECAIHAHMRKPDERGGEQGRVAGDTRRHTDGQRTDGRMCRVIGDALGRANLRRSLRSSDQRDKKNPNHFQSPVAHRRPRIRKESKRLQPQHAPHATIDMTHNDLLHAANMAREAQNGNCRIVFYCYTYLHGNRLGSLPSRAKGKTSLSAAARALALTQPTLGRHIAALEATLGIAVHALAGGASPTVAALELVAHAEAMALSAEALQRAASGDVDQAQGHRARHRHEMIGVEVLPPILAAFRQAHPGIEIELALSNANQDLLRREADIAVQRLHPGKKRWWPRSWAT